MAYNGHEDVVELLLDGGAHLDRADKYGRTPLHFAIGKLEVVKVFLDRGAEIDKEDGNGSTPLRLAGFFRNKEVVQFLLDRGADPVKKNNGGQTPISMARIRGLCDEDWEIFRMMEDKIAKRGQRD